MFKSYHKDFIDITIIETEEEIMIRKGYQFCRVCGKDNKGNIYYCGKECAMQAKILIANGELKYD